MKNGTTRAPAAARVPVWWEVDPIRPDVCGLSGRQLSLGRRKRLIQIVKILVIERGVSRCVDIRRSRIGASTLGKSDFLGAHAREHSDHPEVALMTPGLLVDAIERAVLLRQLPLRGPGFRPCR